MARLPKTEMKAQVFDLCAQNYISIIFVKPHQPVEAIFEDRTICIQPIKSTVSYVSALHEIGHLVDHKALHTRDSLAAEAHAWRWAESEAILWNPTAKKHRDWCLRLYLREAELRPPENHVFWKIYKR